MTRQAGKRDRAPGAGQYRPRRRVMDDPLQSLILIRRVWLAAPDLDFTDARLVAEATVTVLARALDPAHRRRLLHDDYATNVPCDPGGLIGFLQQVATIVHRTPDQARYLAQAVLSTMSEQDDELMASLRLPEYVRDLLAPPAEGGLSAWTDVRQAGGSEARRRARAAHRTSRRGGGHAPCAYEPSERGDRPRRRARPSRRRRDRRRRCGNGRQLIPTGRSSPVGGTRQRRSPIDGWRMAGRCTKGKLHL